MKHILVSLFLFLGLGIIIQSCTLGSGKSTGEEYALVWSDEFDYMGYPDSSKWDYAIGDGCPDLCGWGNNELQYYTRRSLKNARVVDGKLTIELHPEYVDNKHYSSAKLITKGMQHWRYGRFEIRAKLPESNGVWSAIWMLPADSTYGHWPHGGEIDIMENVGFEPDSIVASVHTAAHNFSLGTQKNNKLNLPNISNDFHTYTLDWYPERLVFSVDEQEYFVYQNEGKGYEQWPFDQPMYLILNLAYGGNWGGLRGIEPDKLPQKMEIDYVRVYQNK